MIEGEENKELIERKGDKEVIELEGDKGMIKRGREGKGERERQRDVRETIERKIERERHSTEDS
jgi:hypothetical protein